MKMSESRNKYLIKNTLIFTIGNFGSRIIVFFLIPLYTNVMSTSQYGAVDLITTVCTVLGPVLTLNICESVMRFGLDKNTDKDKITRIGTFIFVLSAVIGITIIPISSMFSQVSEYSVYIYFYAFSLAASQLYLCDLRGKELLLQYSIGNIFQTFMIAILNIYFLVFVKWGTKGYLWAYIIANMLTAIYAIIVGRGYKSFKLSNIDREKMIEMVKYSIVLIPNTFMWWIMNTSDRIMVTSMVSVAANGIYAISYKLPNLVSIFTSVFNQAWSYSAIREDGADDESEYINKVFKHLISMAMLIGIGLLTFTKPILKVYVSPDYYEAWKYTPFLIIGCVYLTLGTFMSTSYTVHKDSFGFLFSGIFGAIFNIGLNFLLIPYIGVYGAAVATCISYIAVFLFRLYHTRKYLKYDIANREFIVGSVTLILSAIMMFVDSLWGLALQIGVCLFAIVFYSSVWIPFLKKIFGLTKIKRNIDISK